MLGTTWEKRLKKLDEGEEAAEYFQKALGITPAPKPLSLEEAILVMQENNLVLEMETALFHQLFRELNLDPAGENTNMANLLSVYYQDLQNGEIRSRADSFFIENSQQFDPNVVLHRLAELSGELKFLTLTGSKVQGELNGSIWTHYQLKDIGSSIRCATIKQWTGFDLLLCAGAVHNINCAHAAMVHLFNNFILV